MDKNMQYEKMVSKAKELISKMTLEEKVLQTLHNSAGVERLGIKAYNWWNEALHGVARAGVATVFPQAIGLAATFDENLVAKVADIISTEGRGKYNMQKKYGDRDIYKGLTFWSPNVNIFRDPRWGRGHETFGEDPYLSSRLGVRFVEGLQGNDPRFLKSAACAKHFAVHSGPEDERHSFNAIVSKQDLYETYLPAFKACVQEAKVEAVMGAYNRTNDEPCCGSKTLLLDILREEWGFKGHVVSDCWAIKDFHEHHKVTSSPVESVAMALKNGCDLNCGNMFFYLEKAVKEGLVSEEKLDEAITNLYVAKMKLGILPFEDNEERTNPYDTIDYSLVDCKQHRQFNAKVAAKTLVLLKNHNNILPLDKSKVKSIGVIGPNSNNRKALVGNYEGRASRYVTILEGIQDYVEEDIRVFYSEGCHLYKDKISGLGMVNDRLAEVKGVCEQSDIVIACMGLDAGLEGEEGDQGNEFASGDKPNLKLPGMQEEILKEIYQSGKPVVLVLLSGSALAVNWADEHVPAIIQGWYPGAQGGKAIAEMLFGECSPEGKLPVTFYRSSEELPDIRDYNMKDRTYRYMNQEALYPFGYGLTYTKFNLENLKVKSEEIDIEQGLEIELDVVNLGPYDGAETVQVYIELLKENTPNPQLKFLKKIHVEKGEKEHVIIKLQSKDFALYDEEANLVINQGEYRVYIGFNQPDSRSVFLTGNEPACIEVQHKKKTIVMEK